MEIIKVIAIPEDVACYIQQLSYEKEGLRCILSSMMLKKSDIKYTTEHYKEFMQHYREINMEYNLALEEVRHTYCKEFANYEEYEIVIHFYECTATVRRRGQCG